jgi:hypothetical protein
MASLETATHPLIGLWEPKLPPSREAVACQKKKCFQGMEPGHPGNLEAPGFKDW